MCFIDMTRHGGATHWRQTCSLNTCHLFVTVALSNQSPGMHLLLAVEHSSKATPEESPASTEPIKPATYHGQQANSGRARRLSTLPAEPSPAPESGSSSPAALPQSATHAGRKRRLSVVSTVRNKLRKTAEDLCFVHSNYVTDKCGTVL